MDFQTALNYKPPRTGFTEALNATPYYNNTPNTSAIPDLRNFNPNQNLTTNSTPFYKNWWNGEYDSITPTLEQYKGSNNSFDMNHLYNADGTLNSLGKGLALLNSDSFKGVTDGIGAVNSLANTISWVE